MTAEFSPRVCQIMDVRSGGVCEIDGTNPATERHHRRPRGMGGTKRDTSRTVAAGLHLCRDCHRMAESYRTVALLLGWLVSSMVDPAARSVLYRGRWALLNEAGGVDYERNTA